MPISPSAHAINILVIATLAWTGALASLTAGEAASFPQWRANAGRTGATNNPGPVFTDPSSIALEEVWKIPMPGEKFGNHSSAVIADGKVYAYVCPTASDDDGKGRDRIEELVCVDLGDGSEVWRQQVAKGQDKPYHNTPCVGEGIVVAILNEGVVCALDAATGAECWRTSIAPSPAYIKKKKETNRKWNPSYNSSAVIADGKVIVAAHALIALGVQDGTLAWQQEEAAYGAGSPAIWRHGDAAYAVGGAGSCQLVDLKDGAIKWTVPAGSGSTTPCLAGDVLAVTTRKNKSRKTDAALVLYRLSPDKAEPIATIAGSYTSPASNGTHIFARDRNTRCCVDAVTGKLVWSQRGTVGDHFASMTLAGKVVLSWTAPHRKPLGEGESKIGFYRIDNGKAIAECDVTRLGECSFPAISGDLIVFRGLESLWCYRAVASAVSHK